MLEQWPPRSHRLESNVSTQEPLFQPQLQTLPRMGHPQILIMSANGQERRETCAAASCADNCGPHGAGAHRPPPPAPGNAPVST
eukprot:9167137-Pyramimonas_sp.AAC.1